MRSSPRRTVGEPSHRGCASPAGHITVLVSLHKHVVPLVCRRQLSASSSAPHRHKLLSDDLMLTDRDGQPLLDLPRRPSRSVGAQMWVRRGRSRSTARATAAAPWSLSSRSSIRARNSTDSPCPKGVVDHPVARCVSAHTKRDEEGLRAVVDEGDPLQVRNIAGVVDDLLEVALALTTMEPRHAEHILHVGARHHDGVPRAGEHAEGSTPSTGRLRCR